MLRTVGVLPINFVTLYAQQIGSWCEGILMSLALADVINQLRKETSAQAKSLVLKVKEIADLNAGLEEKIKQKTIDIEKQKEELLKLEKTEALEKQRTHFFRSISHELRTPLNLIMTPLDSIEEILPGNEDVRMAQRNVKRLLRLVNQLLDFQKLSSGKKDIRLHPINMSPFLRACSEYFLPSCLNKNLRLFVHNIEKKDAYILGQIDALEKIIFNYLSNALKYSPQNGIIELAMELDDTSVIVTVQDEGPGISEENLEKLFKIFSQADEPSSRKYDGSGLGLALVKEFSEALNGKVFVRSATGKGSIFGIQFPRYYMEQSSRPFPSAKNQPSIKNASEWKNYELKHWHINEQDAESPLMEDEENISGDGKMILVVDDTRDMRNLLTKMLKKKSYRFVTAKDGLEGIEKAHIYKPDLIITDWMMPNLSGPEMIVKLASDQTFKHTPTILLTAKNDEESRSIGLQKGAHVFLGKPFDELELFSAMENLFLLKAGEEKIRELNRNLTENVLKRFLPHKLVNEIVQGEKILDDKPRLMEVTILHAELVNFTKKAEELGPHVISLMLNEYFDRMTRVIFEFGGTIDKFIGGGIMIIFGAPENTQKELQAKNAISCALKILDSLEELNAEWKKAGRSEFSVRLGIHMGAGIVGSFGSSLRSEYTVMGPVVNLALEITKVVSPSEIWFSPSIRDVVLNVQWSKAGVFNLPGIGDIMLFKVDKGQPEHTTSDNDKEEAA
ncbi:MAG: response regulator [Oligoflexales bacterium]|nr:response regulator [Oligoflexales bacterium]